MHKQKGGDSQLKLGDSPALLSSDELERLHHLTLALRRHRPSAGRLAGPALSLYRGQGMELEDLRPYQPGDDVRHIAWRATARSGRPVTKVFREERQHLLYLAIDRGPTMGFGTRTRLKAAQGARLAAVLTYSALAQQERVAGVTLDAHGEHAYAAARSLDGALRLLQAAAAPLPRDIKTTANFPALLPRLARAVERHAAVALISDFATLNPEHLPALRALAEHHDVSAFHITDPAEERLPDAGRLRLVGPDGRRYVIDSSDPTLRERYAQAMRERAVEVSDLLRAAGMTQHRIAVDAELSPAALQVS